MAFLMLLRSMSMKGSQPGSMPALLTRMSIFLNSASTFFTAAATSAGLVMSTFRPRAFPPTAPFLGQRQRDRPAEAYLAARARDDGHFPLESEIHNGSSLSFFCLLA